MSGTQLHVASQSVDGACRKKNPRTAAAARKVADHRLLLLLNRRGPIDSRFSVVSVSIPIERSTEEARQPQRCPARAL